MLKSRKSMFMNLIMLFNARNYLLELSTYFVKKFRLIFFETTTFLL